MRASTGIERRKNPFESQYPPKRCYAWELLRFITNESYSTSLKALRRIPFRLSNLKWFWKSDPSYNGYKL
ncbi:hypothetical protein LEP1GSC071_2650 [Leptospira santarosai str. JET]|nr:hypothetical protein LEP1GSC071_2650 [Leptospira santarosai str. JET]